MTVLAFNGARVFWLTFSSPSSTLPIIASGLGPSALFVSVYQSELLLAQATTQNALNFSIFSGYVIRDFVETGSRLYLYASGHHSHP
ncbi:uncharacterized protein BDV17DRAFT_49533 [Aspergillus undulatus]|uniref:uncharacterized protein n=1 Tax=Aspergillus undulatus TaxID=1810928 RepID=UPI003CCCB40F